MDYWDLPARYGSLDAAMARVHGRTLLISFDSDWLYPSAESQAIADALTRQHRPVEYAELSSPAGHDAFLTDIDAQQGLVCDFLATLA
jgi:homoserine O-acetyltransferase